MLSVISEQNNSQSIETSLTFTIQNKKMNILITILFVIASLISLMLIIAIFMKKDHYVKSEIIINAPHQKIFDYVKLLQNQDKFNTHAKVDPDRIEEFKGTDGTVGYIYSWSGNKNAGEGEKEIINIIEGKRIETEIRFIKPMKTSAKVIMDTESISNNQTKVTWSNSGTLKYPLNMMIPLFQKMFAKAMDSSLSTLKIILEK